MILTTMVTLILLCLYKELPIINKIYIFLVLPSFPYAFYMPDPFAHLLKGDRINDD